MTSFEDEVASFQRSQTRAEASAADTAQRLAERRLAAAVELEEALTELARFLGSRLEPRRVPLRAKKNLMTRPPRSPAGFVLENTTRGGGYTYNRTVEMLLADGRVWKFFGMVGTTNYDGKYLDIRAGLSGRLHLCGYDIETGVDDGLSIRERTANDAPVGPELSLREVMVRLAALSVARHGQ
jgi:hypothetical protein